MCHKHFLAITNPDCLLVLLVGFDDPVSLRQREQGTEAGVRSHPHVTTFR